MKDKIEKMYTQALIDDLAPNVFAEQIMLLFNGKDRNEELSAEPIEDKQPVICCFNCVHLGIKPSSGKHWCTNDKSCLSGWISQPHIRKCSLHVLEEKK